MSLGLLSDARAVLLTRLGGLAVYDTDLDVTWLANANAAAGSAFDNGGGHFGSTSDGVMSLANARAWAASLTIGGFNDWRLPMADPSCGMSNSKCTSSELGHLFYLELGGTENDPISNSGDPDLALFNNIQPFYWADANTPNLEWHYHFMTFESGHQHSENPLLNEGLSAWAVRTGDVPLPAALWLFGSSLGGLLGLKRLFFGEKHG